MRAIARRLTSGGDPAVALNAAFSKSGMTQWGEAEPVDPPTAEPLPSDGDSDGGR